MVVLCLELACLLVAYTRRIQGNPQCAHTAQVLQYNYVTAQVINFGTCIDTLRESYNVLCVVGDSGAAQKKLGSSVYESQT